VDYLALCIHFNFGLDIQTQNMILIKELFYKHELLLCQYILYSLIVYCLLIILARTVKLLTYT